MKKILSTLIFSALIFNCTAQNPIELLLLKKDSLQRKIDSIESEINHINITIKKNVPAHGYPSTIINQINSDPVALKVHTGTNSKIIRELPVGEKVYVLEKGSEYFKIKIDGTTGFVRTYNIENNEFIRNMKRTQFTPPKTKSSFKKTQKQKTKSYSSPSYKSKSYKSSKCSSKRCSGYTKKGNRCSRKTTSCSGRCWQH